MRALAVENIAKSFLFVSSTDSFKQQGKQKKADKAPASGELPSGAGSNSPPANNDKNSRGGGQADGEKQGGGSSGGQGGGQGGGKK